MTQKAEFTHREVINRAATWLMNQTSQQWRSAIILREPTSYISTYGTEFPDVLGFSGDNSVNIEVKVSRSDFFNDKNKWHSHPLGVYKFYACPSGLISPDEVPEKFGLLYIDKRGGKLVREPIAFTENVASITPILTNIFLNAVMDGAITREHLRRPKTIKRWDGKGFIL